MRTFIQIEVTALALFLVSALQAAEIVVTFDNVPTQVQCGQTWTNNNVILSFNETTGTEGVGAGYCAFEVDPGYIWLYPSRLVLDFSLLSQPVSHVEADVQYDVSGLYAYSGANNIGQTGNPIAGTLYLSFTNQYPNYCAISAGEGIVSQVRVFTGVFSVPGVRIVQTNGTVTVSWPTNQNPFVLESTGDLTNPAWTPQTNNVGFDGSNFFHNVTVPTGGEYFRLRL